MYLINIAQKKLEEPHTKHQQNHPRCCHQNNDPVSTAEGGWLHVPRDNQKGWRAECEQGVQENDDVQTQKGSLWNEMWRTEAEKALSVPGKVLVQVPCHVQNNLDIFRYFGSKMGKLGTVPAASWFKNNDPVLFRFSVYLSWFSGELLWGLELRDLGKLTGKEGIKR